MLFDQKSLVHREPGFPGGDEQKDIFNYINENCDSENNMIFKDRINPRLG